MRPDMPTMTDHPTESLSAELRLVEPLLGFDEYVGFELTDIDPSGILVSMRSREDPALRFVLTRPEHFFGDYQPELAPVVLRAVGAAEPSQIQVFVILTIVTGLADATANTRAPLVVSPDTGLAVQVILDDESLSMNRPLVA